MAITKVKTYTNTPYYDDYDESKNYHRILFRPGYAVQARELTQLQTALQAQLDRFGQFAFSDGSRVVGSNHDQDLTYDYIKLEDVFQSTVATGSAASYTTSGYVNDFLGTLITGSDNSGNQVTAEVKAVLAAGSGPAHLTTTNDPITLYIKYKSQGGPNKTVAKFAGGEVITSSGGNVVRYGKVMGETGATSTEYVGTTPSTNSALNDGTHVGTGSKYDIGEGVYFISGSFVHVPKQELILDKYTNTPTYRIGLKVTESVISSTTDSSLADNAQGVPNTAAPGANRYQLTTSLIAEPLAIGSRTVDNYIALLETEDGIITYNKLDIKDVVQLNTTINERTFEESGNYALHPFVVDIREDKNDGTNFGVSTSGSVDKFQIKVESNIVYVQGNRLVTGSTDDASMTVDKPRAATDKTTLTGLSTTLPIGNYIKLDPATVKGIPDVTEQKTLTLRNASDATIGTARAKGLEYISSPAKYNLYLYDIVMTDESFGSVENVIQTNSGYESFYGELATADIGVPHESGNESLVYKLPVNVLAADGNSNTFTYNTRIRLLATASSNVATFTLPTGCKLANDDDIQVAVGNNATVEAISVTSGVGAQTFTLDSSDISGTISTGDKVQVIVTALVTNARRRSKVLVTGTTKTITANGSSEYTLDKSDVIKLTSLTSGGVDYKDKFLLNDGQHESYYDVAKIELKGGQTIPNGSYVATFDHFTHTSGDFFDVNSYDSADYTKIPTFNGPRGVMDLRDCVDFRGVKGSGSPTAGAEMSTGTDYSTALPPAPNAIFSFTSNQVYLPRLDKLVLTELGKWKYITGTSALNPSPPDDLNRCMTVFTISVPPYVFNTTNIKPIPVDNKRYTMRDIGKLDKRVKNLEYYTSLSLLEKSAAGLELFTGANSRFKNGFLVDGFYGHNVSNPNNPDNACSIDKDKGVLSPKQYTQQVNMVRTTGDLAATPTAGIDNKAVVSAKGGIVTLPYTTSTFIEQPYASYSEFINPYNIFVWEGKMKLSPESDNWKEVDVRPDIIIDDNSIYDQFVAMAEEEGIFGTVWNEAEVNWTGKDISTIDTTMLNLDAQEAGELGFTNTTGNRNATALIKQTTTATTLTGVSSRSGTKTSMTSDTQLKEVGSNVVEINFIPFMRSRKIYFQAEVLKPNTKLYAFFDGTDVTAYCRQEFSDSSAPYAHVDADFIQFNARTDVKTYGDNTDPQTATSGGSTKGSLVTDAAGRCTGSFIIPRNSAYKFKTGTKEFKLTDSSTNASNPDGVKASAFFSATGLLEVRQKTIISTKIPRLVTSEVREDGVQVSKTTNSVSNELVRWIDPVAQSFRIPPEKSPNGLFLSSIDLYFAAKEADDSIPVEVSIRAVENGYPTQEVIPGADITLYPSDINIHATGNTATNVAFDYPVYLEAGQEYAVVLIANSDAYKVWVAETGAMDVADETKRILKQAALGVFFTSSNSSTWTAEQTKDLKFKLNRCNFTDQSAEIIMNNDVVQPKTLGSSPLEYLTNSTHTTIRVNHPNHNMYGDGTNHVTLAGFADENGLVAGDLNKTHQLTASTIEHDSYVITISNKACTTTGIIGGGTAMTATENMNYNIIKPQMQTIELPDTSIKLYLTAKTGASQDSGESAWSNVAETEILPNKNWVTPTVQSIAGPTTETQNSTGKSAILRAVLDNGGDNFISPVIDIDGTAVLCSSNRVNDPSATAADYSANSRLVAETSGTGGTAVSKYITRKVDLAEAADLLDIYIGVNRPTGSSIDVYYRAQESGVDSNFNTMAWTLATSDNAIPINDNGIYSDVHYAIDPTKDSVGYKFGAFGIKIVFRSSNSSNIPTVTDLRAIATT